MNDIDRKRRRQPRKPVTVLVDVTTSGSSQLITGLISDLSIAGAKFLTNAPFKVSEAVDLSIRLDNVDPDAPTIDTAGTIVRIEALGKNRVGLWSHAVAVQFERELSGHQADIERLAALVRHRDVSTE